MHTPRLLLATLAGLSCIFASTPRAGAQSPCDADITVDGVVDGEDLAALLGSWGVCQGPGVCIADLNSDGVVDGADLTALLDGWGCTGTVLAPTVQSFSPAKAPWFGGGQITITGTNLLGATEVLIGDQVCPSVTVLSATTVTAVVGSNPSRFTAANGFPGSDARPVESVSWTTVQGFLSATNMRLPTEAEWEYACRAGTTTAFHGWPVQPAGTDDDTQVGTIAWTSVNAPNGTQPVGQLAPNGFGLYDMAGNVSEWCSDWYSDTAYGSKPVVDPQGPASSPQQWRVVRGSNILLGAQAGPNYARSSCRDANPPDLGAGSDGFRVVRNP